MDQWGADCQETGKAIIITLTKHSVEAKRTSDAARGVRSVENKSQN